VELVLSRFPGPVNCFTDRVDATPTCGKIVSVSPGPTDQEIVAASAIERVGAALTKQGIVATAAKDSVVPARGVDHVVSIIVEADSIIADQSIVPGVGASYDVERLKVTNKRIIDENLKGIGRVFHHRE